MQLGVEEFMRALLDSLPRLLLDRAQCEQAVKCIVVEGTEEPGAVSMPQVHRCIPDEGIK